MLLTSRNFTGGGFGGHLLALRRQRLADATASKGSNSTSNTNSSNSARRKETAHAANAQIEQRDVQCPEFLSRILWYS